MSRDGAHWYDVAIVGGGPAGASCAAALARAGLNVLVLDKAAFPRHKICGDCINPACWKFFEFIDVADELRRLDIGRISSLRLTNCRGVEISASIANDSRRPFFAISRRALDQILLNSARKHGATVLEQTRVIALDRRDAWQITTRNQRGEKMGFRARHLVGADGRNSLIARLLFGERSQMLAGNKSNGARVAVQWHTARLPELDGRVELFLFESGYCGMVNLDREHANIALVTNAAVASRANTDFSNFLNASIFSNPIARRRFLNLTPIGPVSTAFPIDPRRNRASHPHATLIGDAKQTVEPFTGEGIYFALQDGLHLAHRLQERFGARSSLPGLPAKSRFLVNRVFSPILKRNGLAGPLTTVGARLPFALPWALRAVVRA